MICRQGVCRDWAVVLAEQAFTLNLWSKERKKGSFVMAITSSKTATEQDETRGKRWGS
jgi:hypothetical protein